MRASLTGGPHDGLVVDADDTCTSLAQFTLNNRPVSAKLAHASDPSQIVFVDTYEPRAPGESRFWFTGSRPLR